MPSLVHAAEVPTKEDLSHAGCPVECAGQRPGLDQYLKLHYIPLGAPAWGAAADTLEDVTADRRGVLQVQMDEKYVLKAMRLLAYAGM